VSATAADFDPFAALYEFASTYDYAEQAVLDDLFPKQRDFLNANIRQKALICGRRAGKTETLARGCLDSLGRYPGADQFTGYVTLTKGTSMRNIDGILVKLIAEHNLPINPTNRNGQRIFEHENGHKLWVGGADTRSKADRYRGNKWRRFIIDEAGTFPSDTIGYLIDEAMWPALSDLEGDLIVSGTPGPLEEGFFWKITTPEGDRPVMPGEDVIPQWPTWHWTAWDNPHHPAFHNDVFFAAERERKGWTVNSPGYKREWMGLWATDRDAVIYKYERHRHDFTELPTLELGESWEYILSIDVGWNDATTFTVGASCYGRPDLWIMESGGRDELTDTEIVDRIQQIQRRYPINKIVMDPGGGGKRLGENFNRRVPNVWVEMAEKPSKAAGIRTIQDMLREGSIHMRERECTQLIDEWRVLSWNKKRDGHREGMSDDCTDGLIYNANSHKLVTIKRNQNPQPGTAEFLAQEALRDKTSEIRRAEIEQSNWPQWKKNRALRGLEQLDS
jgi:hypothetical protein